MPTAVLTNEQFPCSPGNMLHTCVDVVGPASYVQIVQGNPVTGGQSLALSQMGFQTEVIWAWTMMSDDGNYSARVALVPFNAGVGSQTGVILQWINHAIGTEVTGGTNLAARTIRIYAIGR